MCLSVPVLAAETSENTILTNYVKAAENADLEFELQEDNSYKIIKRTTPVETIDE